MAFKKVKDFAKKHWKKIALVTGGLTLGGVAWYKLHNSKSDDCESVDETTKLMSIEDRTAWNKDWDAQALALEFATHQPLGPFREPGDDTDEDGYVDPLEGVSYIVAGPNSYYNDSPNTVEIYVLDNDGYYHRKPDDLCNA